MKKIGIYGGSFSPPHEGHFKSALSFYDALSLDGLLIVPAGVPPHKELDGGASSSDRLKLTRLTFSRARCEGRKIRVSDIEIKKEGKSFTYETLQRLSGRGKALYLLMGSDMFLTLHEWKHPEIICNLAAIVLQKREKEPDEEAIEKEARLLKEKYGAAVLMPAFDPIEISSSELRARLASGEQTDGYLCASAGKYIRENGLYGSGEAQLAAIRKRLPEFVSQKRLGHVLSVEKECARMAELFGLSKKDTLILRKAALLHDITHERTPEEQIALAKSLGVRLTKEDLLSPAVLHQFTGGRFAADRFGLEKRGADAISCHTTGKPDMSVPELILCLADYIEETRPYEECKALRKRFYDRIGAPDRKRLLEEAMLAYLEGTVAHLEHTGAHIHKLTLESYGFYKKKLVNYTVL